MGIAQRLTVVKQHDTEPAHHLRAGSRRTHGHTGYRTRRKRSGGAGFQQPSIPAKSPTMVLNPISVLLFLRMDKFFPHPRACLPRMCSARARFARAPISLAAPKPGHTQAPGTYICMMPLTRAHASPGEKWACAVTSSKRTTVGCHANKHLSSTAPRVTRRRDGTPLAPSRTHRRGSTSSSSKSVPVTLARSAFVFDRSISVIDVHKNADERTRKVGGNANTRRARQPPHA